MIDRARRLFADGEVRLVSAVFLSALNIRIMHVLLFGIKRTSDSQDYLEYCGTFAAGPLAAIVQTPDGTSFHFTKLGFMVPFCSFQTLTGGWTTGWIAVQIVMSALTPVLVYYTAKRLLSRGAAIVAGVSLMVLFEAFRYNTHILTESTFTFTVVLSIWAITRFHDEPTRFNHLLVYAAFGWLAVTRPFGLPMVILWAAYDLFPKDSDLRLGLMSRGVPAILLVVGLVAALLFTASTSDMAERIHLWLSDGRIFWSQDAPFPYFDYQYTPRAASNILTLLLFNLDHLIILAILRVGVMFVPLHPLWLTNEAYLLNVFVLTPLLLGTLGAFYRITSRRDFQVLKLWATPMLTTFVIVGLTFINRSNRFRTPIAPVFVLLTAYFVWTSPRLSRYAERAHEVLVAALRGEKVEVDRPREEHA